MGSLAGETPNTPFSKEKGEKMKTISAKVSDEIYQTICEICELQKVTKSELIKQSILNAKIVNNFDKMQIQLERNYQLSAIGNNLNQISKYCNQKKSIDRLVLSQLKAIEEKANDM